MKLYDKIQSISKDQITHELNILLDNPRVTISWWGQRLVSVNDFQGEVDVNIIAAKYLKGCPRPKDGTENLKKRIDHYRLWSKIEKLCKDDHNLNKTWVYQYLVPIKEGFQKLGKPSDREYIVSPLRGTKFPSEEEFCFSFFPDDFQKLWPNQEPQVTHLLAEPHICVPSAKQVESYINSLQ